MFVSIYLQGLCEIRLRTLSTQLSKGDSLSTPFSAFGSTPRSPYSTLQLPQIFVESVGHENLTAPSAALPPLHLDDSLPSLHFDFLFFHAGPSLLHLVQFLLVACLFLLPLLPLVKGNLGHDLHRLFRFALLFLHSVLVLIFQTLLVHISLLSDKTVLEPHFEGTVPLFMLGFLFKSGPFPLSQLFLLL